MKAFPTLEGGLRIDTGSARDWTLLRGIIADASGRGIDLASRLGGLISEEAGSEDWEEYIVPDLREAFQDELAQVGAAIESAIFTAEGKAGSLWITREDAYPWYSALNQARLALEEHYHFGDYDDLDPDDLPPGTRSALTRSVFYFDIQSLLLRYVLR